MRAFDGSHTKNITSSDVISLESNGWNIENQRIVNQKDPVMQNDAVTLGYINTKYLDKATGGSIQGGINMNQNNLFNLPNPPPFNSSAASKLYVDTNINNLSNTYMNKSTGGSIHGGINMNQNNLFNLPNPPQYNSSATSKLYVDDINTNLDARITANNTNITNIISWLQIHHGCPNTQV